MAKVITDVVRFSYVNVFVPRAIQEGQEKTYSIMAIIRKDDAKTINALKAAYKQAAEEGKERFGKAFKPTPFIRPEGSTRGVLIDADEDSRYAGDKAYEGCYLMNAKAKAAPGVLAKETGKKKLTADDGADLVYSGCYGKLSISLFPYSTMGYGIGVGLNNVLKTRDGEMLGGRSSAEADFADDLEDESDYDDLL